MKLRLAAARMLEIARGTFVRVHFVVWMVALLGLIPSQALHLPGPPDVYTYLAAAERLNVGHNLYGPLLPGDRFINTSIYEPAPLISPPLIAVLWRPLAVLPDPAGAITGGCSRPLR
jgi:hypothetical protein